LKSCAVNERVPKPCVKLFDMANAERELTTHCDDAMLQLRIRFNRSLAFMPKQRRKSQENW